MRAHHQASSPCKGLARRLFVAQLKACVAELSHEPCQCFLHLTPDEVQSPLYVQSERRGVFAHHQFICLISQVVYHFTWLVRITVGWY